MPNVYRPELTGQLHDDHRYIDDLISAVEESIRNNDEVEGRDRLYQLRVALEGHWANENWKLYTFLQRMALDNDKKLNQINSIRKDMDDCIAYVISFFNKYEKSAGVASIAADFSRVKALIHERSFVEESVLFPGYELHKQAS